MKDKIHPQYHTQAQVRCACGNVFAIGSTKEYLETEVCSKCHPFYTGKDKFIDTAGRVEKFRQKIAKQQTAVKKKPAKK